MPSVLLNVLNEDGKISRSHGIPAEILQAQAVAAKIPIHLIESSWTDYESKFTAALTMLKKLYQLNEFVFGDIDLDAHREWEEKVCGTAGLHAVLPLWKAGRRDLVNEMLAAGIETMIVSCNVQLGEKFLGKILNEQTINELDNAGVDVCGENGEFHTLVLNCPLFTSGIEVRTTDKVLYQEYWLSKLELL